MKNEALFPLIAASFLACLYFFFLSALGFKGIILLTALIAIFLALSTTPRHTHFALVLVILTIGLCPFFWSIKIGPSPKIYGEDIMLIYYIGYMFLFYGFINRKNITLGDKKILFLYIIFVILVFIEFASSPIAENAPRNFVETSILGFILYIIMTNEINKKNIFYIINAISITGIAISFIIFAEVIAQSNPIMQKAEEIMEGFLYIEPIKYTHIGSYYRPYAVFFHPSEAGTYLAMTIPFLYCAMRKNAPWIQITALGLAGTALVLNSTRGVWVAVAIVLPLCNFSQFRRFLPAIAAAGILAGGTAYLTLGDTPFFNRLFDPANLYNRIYYWKVGLNMFMDSFPLGIGHMNFENTYLQYVNTEVIPPELDVKQIFVADSIFFTSLIEYGLFGLLLQILLYASIIKTTLSIAAHYRAVQDLDAALIAHAALQAMLIYLLAGAFADVHFFSKATKLFFISLGVAMALRPPSFGLLRSGSQPAEVAPS